MRASTGRSYQDALNIIDTRRRASRPTTLTRHEQDITESAPHEQKSLRGSPAIVGMQEWLQQLGHTQDEIAALNIIHFAGTKGKGSTCAFTSSLLQAHGRRTGFPRKVGLYTSPHLILPEERIRLNHVPIGQELFARYFFELYDRFPQLHEEFDEALPTIERGPRYLQLFALLAFHVFIREKVDMAIFETHCGGEYDATNIIRRPLATAVTALGMDHVDMLGPSIDNIAWHKSGIFKTGAPALSSVQQESCNDVLIKRAIDKQTTLRFVDVDSRLPSNAAQLSPSVQRQNASLALAAAEVALKQCAPPTQDSNLTQDDIKNGVDAFSWPGRFQIIRQDQHIWYVDAAHNDMSAPVAAEWFAAQDTKGQPRILIYSHVNEMRDATQLLQTLGHSLIKAGIHIDHVVTISKPESRLKDISQSKKSDWELFHPAWREIDPQTQLWNEADTRSAIDKARELGQKGGHTLITGSQHLVGPALKILQPSI